MKREINNPIIKICIALCTVTVIGAPFLQSCSSDDATRSQSPQVSQISIHPQEASLEVGQQLDFSVVALTATGEVIDTDEINIEWQWWSTDTDVFTVEPGGLATAQNPGEAFCMIEAVVDVSQRTAEEIDVIYASISFGQGSKSNIQSLKLELAEEVAEYYDTEHVAMKKRLRFTGRDSAFVFVF
jgi:hypothetical protein